LMNMWNMDYADAFLPFNQLTMPVYATLGNHDNMWNTEAVFEIFKKTSIVPLRNQSITIDGMQIVGIDDKSYRGKKWLPEILKESNIKDNGKYTILISHQPQKLSKLDWYPIDFEFAGHTHKWQFLPMNLLIGLFNDYSYGHYQDGEKNAFVSQGIGTWWAPIRIGTQSELVLISLVKK
jgi:predicted MPP superfamily phosphohydrolase